MPDGDLVLPVLIDPDLPSASTSPLPVRPTHIASWHRSGKRHIALADAHSCIWIHSSPLQSSLPSPNAIPPSPHVALPTISTPTPPRSRPSTSRHSSFQRNRASSTASSAITSSSRRLHAAFSPPTSSRPAAVVTSTTATAQEGRQHRSNRSGSDLRDHLREQGAREEHNVGLGIGLGRRSLHIHGSKEEATSNSGAMSPKSNASGESSRTTRWTDWMRNEEDEKREREQDLKEKMEEVEVEREMEREVREENREREERKVIERATTPKSGTRSGSQRLETVGKEVCVKRIFLPDRGKGKIVHLQVFRPIGVVAVLRDEGTLDMLSLETLQVITSLDLEREEPAESKKFRLSPFWSWRKLHLVHSPQGSLIVADGVPWPCGMPSPSGEVTRVALVQCVEDKWTVVNRLELPGQGHVGICKQTQVHHLLHFLPFSLTSYPITFPSLASSQLPPPSRSQTPTPRAVSSTHPSSHPDAEPLLRRNRSFAALGKDEHPKEEKGFAKFLASRSKAAATVPKDDEESKIGLGEGKEVERDGYGEWKIVEVLESGDGVGVSDDAMDVFRCDGSRLAVRGSLAIDSPVEQVSLSDGASRIYVTGKGGLRIYQPETLSTSLLRIGLQGEFPGVRIAVDSGEGESVVVTPSAVETITIERSEAPENLFDLSEPESSRNCAAIVPLSVDQCVTADGAGNVIARSLADVLHQTEDSIQEVPDVDCLESPVTLLKAIEWSNGKLVVAGDEDGVVRLWTAEPFALQGSFTLFADPVHRVALVDSKSKSPLKETLLCVSEAGTVGVISLSDVDQLYLIPASRAPLRRLFLNEKDLLLAYANGKARVWNTQTCEFRRSTGLDAAEEMLLSGEWSEVMFEDNAARSPIQQSTGHLHTESDTGRLLHFDLREISRWAHSTKATQSPLNGLRTALAAILPFSTTAAVDEAYLSKLGIAKPATVTFVGTGIHGADIFATSGDSSSTRRDLTGTRQLAIVSLLRPFLDSPDHEHHAAEAIAYYTGSANAAEEVDLAFFARYYMDSASDIHQAARMLFQARLSKMTEVEIEAVVNAVQTQLPISQVGAAQKSAISAQALTLVGGIALHQYQSINPSTLKAAAESIVLYLSDSLCPHLALAMELASKGFSTWQSYIDPMDMLRLLFYLSTHSPPPAAISAQARLAVLHIANVNPALFMSTLSMDILDARTVEGRTSIMKLCVFMARKKPTVIQTHLPRIAEAVVKSLDPNVGKMREDVQETATVILNELVLAFSTIDFHSGTQRLAVGTHEGAVIMYDLKTASRLYVLEPHREAVSSVVFSPDGRRLVTVSLESGDVTVWKVGSSLSGFFNVGGPPRQGGEKGEPFKRIVFMRADDRPLEETSALSDIRIEWPGARQARVIIKETALTFET